jgi:hypothetical protein
MACRECSQNDHSRPALDVARLASAAARVKISLGSWDAGGKTPMTISTDKAEASRSNHRVRESGVSKERDVSSHCWQVNGERMVLRWHASQHWTSITMKLAAFTKALEIFSIDTSHGRNRSNGSIQEHGLGNGSKTRRLL